jgi:hypothetical protein
MLHSSRSVRRLATVLTTIGLATLVASGSVLAGTPVTVGYRDHSYGGGAFRPSADKAQSKAWYTADGQWWAGMFRYTTTSPLLSETRIWKLTADKTGWTMTNTRIDSRDDAHGDYLWDEAADKLYVVSASAIPDNVPTSAINDAIMVFEYTYAAGVYTLVPGFPKTIPNTASVPNVSSGGAPTVTIAKDSTGDLWAVWPHSGKVFYSISTDDGATWSAPAQHPSQVGNSIKQSPDDNANDEAAVIAFGADQIGVMWSDHDDLPVGENGYYFATITAGQDPTVGGNWTKVKLPTLLPTSEQADNHINLKTTSDGSVYMVGKTGADTDLCATNKQAIVIEVFDRTPGGTWTAHLAATNGDCNTRAQMVISEQLDTMYLFLTSPNGGGAVYRKAAPLSGPTAFDFRGAADQTSHPGIPFIKSATETLIDDVSTTKQVVTSTSGIAVIANNVRSIASPTGKFYLHNFMTLPASDNTPPTGTVAINGAATGTTSTAVSVAVPATDNVGGSGLSLVRLANTNTTSGGVLNGAGATSFVYGTPVAWTLPAGDGNKTVYVQWRDAAGNWSTPIGDSIFLDNTAPTGTVQINSGDTTTTSLNVTLNLTADDGTGSGVEQVLISNTGSFVGVTPVAYAATLPWTLTPGNGSKTVSVKFIDGAGNTSVAAATDDITVASADPFPPSTPGLMTHVIFGSGRYGVPVRLTWGASTDVGLGVASYQLQRRIDGGLYTTVGTPTTNGFSIDLSNSAHTYQFRVRALDGNGNYGPFRYDTAFRTISYGEASAAVHFAGSWPTSTSVAYVGGKAKVSTATSASATLTFSGNRVGWLSRMGPTSGSARVYIDGSFVKTVNLHSATTKDRALVFVKNWSAIGTHTIKIVVSGTGRVTYDQVFVLR